MKYEELVKALRCCGNPFGCNSNCPMYKRDASFCRHELINDAAAAIEALQAEVERLQVDLDAAWALMEVQDG